jgi:hypothetical protein
MVESHTQATQKIVDRYIEAGQPWPATVKQIAAWAIESKLWAPPPSRLISGH